MNPRITEFNLETIGDNKGNLLGYYAISTAQENVDHLDVPKEFEETVKIVKPLSDKDFVTKEDVKEKIEEIINLLGKDNSKNENLRKELERIRACISESESDSTYTLKLDLNKVIKDHLNETVCFPNNILNWFNIALTKKQKAKKELEKIFQDLAGKEFGEKKDVHEELVKISKHLTETETDEAEIIITIHGYSSKYSAAKEVYADTYEVAKKSTSDLKAKQIFLGYRWPSEPAGFPSAFKPALELMPTLLIQLLVLGLSLVIITGVLFIFLDFNPVKVFLNLSETLKLVIGKNNQVKLTILLNSLLPILFWIGILFLCERMIYVLKLGSASNLNFTSVWFFLLGLILTILPRFIPPQAPYYIIFLFFAFIAFAFIVIIFGISCTALFLRMSNYFRDAYRANNYGVLDLVELLRQIDKYVFEQQLIKIISSNKESELEKELNETVEKANRTRDDKQPKISLTWNKENDDKILKSWKEVRSNEDKLLKIYAKKVEQTVINKTKRIKLTFLGHSMGCFVVTNTIRILSDVFDPSSVEKNHNRDIGRFFCLERLILVAPDIPVETIISRRGNFLSSSLSRFEEAYIFCNEGDIVLRILSTAANYFSFPARQRIWLYRLGNIAASGKDYGIINVPDFKNASIELRTINKSEKISKLEKLKLQSSSSSENIADKFTYFDCTDYKDITKDCTKPKGIVSDALKKRSLSFWDYVSLLRKGSPDTHSGYFEGIFSKEIIYGLAFLGFKKFIKKLNKEATCKEATCIENLHEECMNKQIKVILSPKLGGNLNCQHQEEEKSV